MLGGPVAWGEGSEPWTPEEKLDKAALDFVLKTYKKRSADLTQQETFGIQIAGLTRLQRSHLQLRNLRELSAVVMAYGHLPRNK